LTSSISKINNNVINLLITLLTVSDNDDTYLEQLDLEFTRV